MTTKLLNAGTPAVVEAESPNSTFSVVFEDDGETGYFYALDHSREDQPIVTALFIYDVPSLADRDRPSVLQISWSLSGNHAMLLINSRPHAVVDFSARRGYCRTALGTPSGDWTNHSHAWDDAALRFFE